MNSYDRLNEYIEKYKKDSVNTINNMKRYYNDESDHWFIIEELLAEIIRQEKANVILDDENSELQGRINNTIEFIGYGRIISNMNNPSVFGEYEKELLKRLEGNSNE